MLVTGGYTIHLAGAKLDATKLWPAIVAMLGLLMLRLVVRCGSLKSAVAAHPRFFVFSVAMIVFLCNGRTISGGDSVPAKNLPLSILREGNFYLDRLVQPGAKKIPYYLRESDGHYISDYPVGAALLALPFYVPSVAANVSPAGRIFAELEKVSAATIVALSAVLVFAAAAQLTSLWMALAIACVYAFASSNLSVASQALWQHGPAELALAAAIYCLVRARGDPRWAAYAGFPLAVEVVTRPVDFLLAAPLTIYVFFYYRRQFLPFIAGTIPALAFQLWYNAAYFGNPLRMQFFGEPSAAVDQLAAGSGLWSTPFFHGMASVLLSPGRGLLFYSPIFALSLAMLAMAWRRGGDVLLRSLSIGTLLVIIVDAKWNRCTGGNSYGPRLLADLSPVLALALYPLEAKIRRDRAMQIAVALLAGWSIMAHAIGAYSGDLGWNLWALKDPGARMWLWSDNPVVNPLERRIDSMRIAMRHVPTSRDSPNLLDAECGVRGDLPTSVAPGGTVSVPIRARNTGRAVWRAGRTNERGAVSLRWQWQQNGKRVGEMEASRGLHLDVFPGDSIDLEAALGAPDKPGDYVMAIGLMSEGSGAFGSQLRVAVTVAVAR